MATIENITTNTVKLTPTKFGKKDLIANLSEISEMEKINVINIVEKISNTVDRTAHKMKTEATSKKRKPLCRFTGSTLLSNSFEE